MRAKTEKEMLAQFISFKLGVTPTTAYNVLEEFEALNIVDNEIDIPDEPSMPVGKLYSRHFDPDERIKVK